MSGVSFNQPVRTPLDPFAMPFRDEELEATWATLELLGRTVRRARVAHHWSQRELAELAEIDQTSISLFELGRFPGMRVVLLARMAEKLGLEIEGLAPRERFIDDAVVEALRIARLREQGLVCPTCHSVLRTPIRSTNAHS